MTFSSPRRSGAEINLTPLIDILFIVLLFLVLTASFSERTVLQIELPKTSTGERIASPSDRIRIVVNADGKLYIEDHPQTLDDVGRRLDAIPDKEDMTVVLAADHAASHGRVIQVMDRVRQAGIVRLDIETLSRDLSQGR